MEKENFKLGTLLKTLRKEKETTRSLAKKIGYSHSYISSVENGSKLSPSNDFIQKYLLEVNNKSVTEANYFIDLINRLSEGLYNFELLPSALSDEVKEINKELRIANQKFENIHLFVSKQNGKTKEVMFEEPINDLNFHLSEIDNLKYFKGIQLSHEEMEEIQNLINNYLKTVYKTQLLQTYFLYSEGKLDKDDLEKYSLIYNKALQNLDNDFDEYNALKHIKNAAIKFYKEN